MSDVQDGMTSAQPAPLDYTMTEYVAANAAGMIMCAGLVPRYIYDVQIAPAGGSLVFGIGHPATDYVENGAIVARPANPAVLNGTVLTGLPNPSTVTINGTAYTVTDGELDMTFPNAGTYAIAVTSPFPYLDAAFTHTQ
jgi:hypothetical protein